MLPKISLLDELRKGGYESSLITTYNAYLPFYEEVVLRRLVNAGIRHNVLMMDAKQYAASINHHPPSLAGRRYSLIPIDVPGTFHPKLIMLFGKRKGLVAVGSHNTTLAGFGFNRELTNVVRVLDSEDAEGQSIAHGAWSEVERWIQQFALNVPQQAIQMIRRCRDFAPWLSKTRSRQHDTRLLSSRPGSPNLWQQFSSLVTTDVEAVSVTGAFFDQKLEFLQRIRDDLNPKRLVVGVDPDSVQLPSVARDLKDIDFCRADRLGAEEKEKDKDNEVSGRYFHAKALLVKQNDGHTLLASGSANPSRPAWLAKRGSGNVEMMLVRQGASALDAASATGLIDLFNSPLLADLDWTRITENPPQAEDWSRSETMTGLAVAEDGLVRIHCSLLAQLDSPEFVLTASNSQEISRTKIFEDDGQLIKIQFSPNELVKGTWISCFDNGNLTLKLLLHHTHEVEEQARTGIQRQFKDALLSLNTDSPDISLLIKCIDKIVFSQEQGLTNQAMRVSKQRDDGPEEEAKDLISLAIDVDQIRKRTLRKRLEHTSDFAYLLNTLIYHLGIKETEPMEELDRFGRSEEEQVEADDDEDAANQGHVPDPDDLLKLCHSKVRTLVNRMNAQIDAYKRGKQDLPSLLMRLLAVLAILRELRNCDGRVVWVDRGKTTVPEEERLRLLEGIMFSLFEGNTSLLRKHSLDDETEASEDIARVKGLIVWLAWDCGLTLNLQKPFMESPRQLETRLRNNSIILALAQMINRDEIIIDEAEKSIGSLTSSEFDWLNELQWVMSRSEALRSREANTGPAYEDEPGNIAIHKTKEDWQLRIVESRGGKYVSLLRLDHDKPSVTFLRDHLIISSLRS